MIGSRRNIQVKMKRRRGQGTTSGLPQTQVDLGLRSMAISDAERKVQDSQQHSLQVQMTESGSKNPNGRKSRRNERNNASLVLSSEMLDKGSRGRP